MVKLSTPAYNFLHLKPVTESHHSKFLHKLQKWLPINLLQSKLQYSNPFRNASVPNEWWSSNWGRVGILQNLCQFNNPHTYAYQCWSLVKIAWVVAELFSGIFRFLPSHQKGAVVTLVISGFTGPIFIKFVLDVAKILPLNFCESEWWYCNPFWNVAVPNEHKYPNFPLKLVTMVTSLEESEKEVQINHLRTNTYHFVKKSVKKSLKHKNKKERN